MPGLFSHSTHIKVRNDTDKEVFCKLTWGWGNGLNVDETTVKPGSKVELKCEYVWYDLRVFYNSQQVAYRAHVKGEATPQTWVIHQDDKHVFHIDWDYGKRMENLPHKDSQNRFDWKKHQEFMERAMKELGDPGDIYKMASPAYDGLSYGA